MSRPQQPEVGTKALLVTIALLGGCLGSASSGSGWEIVWIDQFGTPRSEGAVGIAADTSGAYVAGYTFGELPGQTSVGSRDAFVRKVDPEGAVLWTDQFGTATLDFVAAAAADATGVYVAGSTFGLLPGEVSNGASDAFVRKYSPAGLELWTEQFGTSGRDGPVLNGLAVHPAGVFVTGATSGAFPGETASGSFDIFLAMLDPGSGSPQWIRQFGTPGTDVTSSLFGGVAADSTGVYVVANLDAGSFFGASSALRKYDFEGNLLWHQVVGSVGGCGPFLTGVATHANGVYLSGQASSVLFEGDGTCPDTLGGIRGDRTVGVLSRYDTDGGLVWTRTLDAEPEPGGDRFTGAKGVAAFESGVYVTGNLLGSFAGHLFQGSEGDEGACGPNEGPFFSKLDGYVRRFDFDGKVIWTRQFGGPDYELMLRPASDGMSLYGAGETSCRVDEAESFFGASDAFVVRFEIEPISLAGRIQLLMGRLETLRAEGQLNHNEFRTLAQLLESALYALDHSQAEAAAGTLRAFINQVDAAERRAALSATEASALREGVRAILDRL